MQLQPQHRTFNSTVLVNEQYLHQAPLQSYAAREANSIQRSRHCTLYSLQSCNVQPSSDLLCNYRSGYSACIATINTAGYPLVITVLGQVYEAADTSKLTFEELSMIPGCLCHKPIPQNLHNYWPKALHCFARVCTGSRHCTLHYSLGTSESQLVCTCKPCVVAGACKASFVVDHWAKSIGYNLHISAAESWPCRQPVVGMMLGEQRQLC